MAKYFKVLLLLLIVSPIYVHGWDFFGLFKKKEATTTATPPVEMTTQRAFTTTTPSNGACWWTLCGTRCTATASVHDFSAANCISGQYKFRCCAA